MMIEQKPKGPISTISSWESPVIKGTLVRRYKRFLADVTLPDGSSITAHCPNSGSMMGLDSPGIPVLLTQSSNPKRKYAYTLECVMPDKSWVCVNTNRANTLTQLLLNQQLISHWDTRTVLKKEPRFGNHTRFDFLLSEKTGQTKQMLLEVKSTTLSINIGVASFPDAITDRGRKHIRELMVAQKQGYNAGILFMCMRGDCNIFQPASQIDPAFAKTLKLAIKKGVQVKCLGIHIDLNGFHLREKPLVICI